MLCRRPSHVAIYSKLDIRADRLAHEAHAFDVGGVVVADLYLDRTVPGAHPLARELRHVLGLAEGHGVAQWDAVPGFAAEQVVDGRVEGFAEDVPERHLDPGLGLFNAV